MSQSFQPGWVDAVCEGAKSPDEQTRAKALGVKPRRNFRVIAADVEKSRARGSRRGAGSRYALRNLPPITEEDE
jgi:hypothetical protein